VQWRKFVDKFVAKSVDKFIDKSVDKFVDKSVDKFQILLNGVKMSDTLHEDFRTFYFWRGHKFALDTFRTTIFLPY
jgi:hypothetical protein